VNCWLLPSGILGFAGVSTMDCSTAGDTVNVVDPEALPSVAVIAVEPAVRALASPLKPGALLMTVATDGVALIQAAKAVTS